MVNSDSTKSNVEKKHSNFSILSDTGKFPRNGNSCMLGKYRNQTMYKKSDIFLHKIFSILS